MTKVISCVLATILLYICDRTNGQQSCASSDVVIVLDESESMRIYDSEQDTFTFAADYRSILTDVLNSFPPDKVNVSLVSYSTTAQVLAGLTSDFKDLIIAVGTRQSNAEFAQQRIDLGIAAATNELVNFGRPDVDKYIIVFLDGTSVDDDLTRAAVIDAGNANITLIAINMRGTLDESSVIAGRSFRTFFVNTPSELNFNTDIIGNVTDIICQECKGYADVVYLLDGSDSTRRIAPDFSSTFYAPGIIGFVKNTTLTVNMGPIRKGIVVYSKTAQIIQSMTGDADSIIAAVEATDPEYENTNAHLAFSVGKEVFDFADPQRAEDVDKLIVYLVDGFVNDKEALANVSRDIRDEGILVAGVGFSPSAVFSDLLIATGNPNNIFRVATDMDLEELVTPLVEFLCRTRARLLRSFRCEDETAGDDICQDVYEKWLRRRIDYAAIRETGNHAAPGFIHTLVHAGDCHDDVTSELRHEMWRSNKYPDSNFFLHDMVLYHYPDIVKENLDLRFSICRDPSTSSSETPGYKKKIRNIHNLNFKELATVPIWEAPVIVSRCPLPHTLETPMTWPLSKEQLKAPSPCPYRTCVSDAQFPACCHRKDNVCSSVYCHEPLPEAVYNVGPRGRGEPLVKWRIGVPSRV